MIRYALLPLLLALVVTPSRADLAVTPPSTFCGVGATDDTFCVPELEFQQWITDDELEILDVERTAQGVSGAKKILMRAPWKDTHVLFHVKWKKLPLGRDRFNNSPRRELAAQAIAEMVLPPGRTVVPPTAVRCMPEGEHLGGDLPGLDCEAGLISLWLHNVTQGDYYDADRWARDPDFRDAMADFNLLTYLIDHRDSRDANFLKSTDPENPRILSIDNGLAFSGFRNTQGFFRFARMDFEADYRDYRVPGISQEHVDALRALTRDDLDSLAVVKQFEVLEGDLVPVPPTEPIRPARGHARKDDVLQFGLSTREIDSLEERIAALLLRVDAGTLETY